MDIKKIAYWVATAAMCGIFLYSAQMYFTKYEMVKGFFSHLGFPTYIVYPLAIAKVLGVIAVLVDKPRFLAEWAYAGFFFDAVLATMAHHDAGHALGLSLYAILLVILSRVLLRFRHSTKD